MSGRPQLPIVAAGLAVMALGVSLGCKPWTVRPIEETGGAAAGTETFDPKAYVAGIWTTKVVPVAKASAVDLRSALDGATPHGPPVLVRGDGTIVRVDRTSRVGLALLDLAPADGTPDVALQIGPVLRGTAVRDALPFIRFGDFANQVAFADVANALNARVSSAVLGDLDVAALEGRRVTFWGAATFDARNTHRLPEVVPVALEGLSP